MANAYSNAQMSVMLESLERFLGRRDIIGYAAARNTRILTDASLEFIRRKDELIREYGTDDGNGCICINAESDNFPAFEREIAEYAVIEHEVELFKLPFDNAIDKLTGSELLEIDWMFEEE